MQVNSKNVLLVRDDVGTAKRTTYNLPNENFAYGKKNRKNEEGAKEVCMTWKYHDQSEFKVPNRDFKQLNKMALTQGLFTSEQQKSFRKQNDARSKVVRGQTEIPLYIPDYPHVYGKTNKPSTPIKLVVGNCFGLHGQNQMAEIYRQKSLEKRQMLIPKDTKSSCLAKESTIQKLETIQNYGKEKQFKLKKYNLVENKVNTNNNNNNKFAGK